MFEIESVCLFFQNLITLVFFRMILHSSKLMLADFTSKLLIFLNVSSFFYIQWKSHFWLLRLAKNSLKFLARQGRLWKFYFFLKVKKIANLKYFVPFGFFPINVNSENGILFLKFNRNEGSKYDRTLSRKEI